MTLALAVYKPESAPAMWELNGYKTEWDAGAHPEIRDGCDLEAVKVPVGDELLLRCEYGAADADWLSRHPERIPEMDDLEFVVLVFPGTAFQEHSTGRRVVKCMARGPETKQWICFLAPWKDAICSEYSRLLRSAG